MLNRLYIVIGIVAILAIAAAFIVPNFIPWVEYRDRMEAMAGEALGAPVTIAGEISFSLLPQPKLEFSEVSVGPAGAPSMTVGRVEADFSLIDFIRDRYSVTRLLLDQPEIMLGVKTDGTIDAGFSLAEAVPEANVSIASAVIRDGAVQLTDARSGATYATTDIGGEVRLDALRGPFAFQGRGTYEGRPFTLRATTAALDQADSAQIALTLRPLDEKFSLTAEGNLQTGAIPRFSGTMTYRQRPPAAAEDIEDASRGDLVVTSRIEASPERLRLTEYTVVPDENRGTTRLGGAAEVTLGSAPSFNAVISGGLLALPPRDATAEQGGATYEIVRLLDELPAPPLPPVPGTIGVDITELNLRGLPLRNVRIDASATKAGWTVRQFAAQLPGNGRLHIAGALTVAGARPEFAGTLRLAADRLDALATLWRKPPPGNPLFNMPGSVEARVNLVGETLSISDGRLTLDGEAEEFSAQLGVGAIRDLRLTAHLGELDDARSAALVALLPEITTDGDFAATFPKGAFELTADAAAIGGLSGRALATTGSWDGGVLVVDRLAAGDLGGARLDLALTAFGSLAAPELSGGGTIALASSDAAALDWLLEAVEAPESVARFVRGSMPAELSLRLEAPDGDGSQTLTLSGRAGVAEITAHARLRAGFVGALGGPVTLQFDAVAEDAAAMSAQLGLGDFHLAGESGPLHLVAIVDGNVANSLETTLLLEGGGDSLRFSGDLVVSDPEEFSGKGTVKATLGDPSALAELMGAGGITLPQLSGTAALEFTGTSLIRLDGLSGVSGGKAFAGDLALRNTGRAPVFSGNLALGSLELDDVLRVFTGPAALLNSAGGPWPDGPLSTGTEPRQASGRISISAEAIASGGRELVTKPRFVFDWDPANLRIRQLQASIGEGKLTLDLGICCSGPLADKHVNGRLSLTDVRLADIVPPAIAEALSGTVNGSAQFEATGDSVAGLVSEMTGSGSYQVAGLTIERLDPGAFGAVGTLGEVLELEPEVIATRLVDELDDGPFASASAAGEFTIAGGVVRSPNVAIDGDGGRLFGSLSVRLANLGLDGGYVLNSTATDRAQVALDVGSARVATSIAGTLEAPERSFDVSGLVDAILFEAFQAEVTRLEKLQAEDEARRAAAAAERARLELEEAARREADEASAAAAAERARPGAEGPAAGAGAEPEVVDRPVDIGFGN